MNVYEIYFSPTGGTKKAADILSHAWDSQVVPVDLTSSQTDSSAYALTKEDAAILAVPSYGGRVPAPATERLSKGTGQRRPCGSCVCLWQPRL